MDLESILNRFTDQTVKFKRSERKHQALDCWEPIVKNVLDYVKEKDRRFASLETLYTGGFYERTKVKKPDEFDLMLLMPNLELGDDEPFDEDDGLKDPPIGFTTVMIDQGEEKPWQADGCVNQRGMLRSVKVKEVFTSLVKDAVRGYGSSVTVECNGPAVTLTINGRVSVDLTLAIKDRSWPDDAEEWKTRHRNGWPSQSLVNKICREGCYLVPKPPKGHSVPEHEKEYLWRYSFDTKTLFREGDRNQPNSCRKKVYRILKALREELDMHPLKSYHLKTVVLYEYEANPDPSQWKDKCLSKPFLSVLQRLENCLQQVKCPDYFIPEVNLFESLDSQKCLELAKRVRKIKLQPENELRKLIK